jgi:hypothetical protein
MPFTDSKGLTWTRSADRREIVSSAGDKVFGNPESTDEHLVATHYLAQEPIKTDADRIAELESKLAALLSKLS